MFVYINWMWINGNMALIVTRTLQHKHKDQLTVLLLFFYSVPQCSCFGWMDFLTSLLFNTLAQCLHRCLKSQLLSLVIWSALPCLWLAVAEKVLRLLSKKCHNGKNTSLHIKVLHLKQTYRSIISSTYLLLWLIYLLFYMTLLDC